MPSLVDKIVAESAATYPAWLESVRAGTAATVTGQPFDQLAAWREATGLVEPATVPLELRAVVGNLTLTVRGKDQLPAAVGPTLKALLAGKRRKLKPKSMGKPAMFAALTVAHGWTDPQGAAYHRAMSTGRWA